MKQYYTPKAIKRIAAEPAPPVPHGAVEHRKPDTQKNVEQRTPVAPRDRHARKAGLGHGEVGHQISGRVAPGEKRQPQDAARDSRCGADFLRVAGRYRKYVLVNVRKEKSVKKSPASVESLLGKGAGGRYFLYCLTC